MIRFILRMTGTWMLGMSLIFMVMDGTRSLAASDLVTTSIGNIWILAHAESLSWLQNEGTKGSLRIVWEMIGIPLLQWPGWAVLGLPGIMLVFAGRNEKRQ